jgi:plastocyanin
MAASAHEGREVGEFELTVGFLSEPAYEGEPNGVSLRIAVHHEEGEATGQASGHGGMINEVVAPGARYSHSFAHEYEGREIVVHVHPADLMGKVVVGHEGESSEQTVMITAAGFEPATVSVQADTTVTWVNMTSEPVSLMDGDLAAAPAAEDHAVTGQAANIRVAVTHMPTGASREFELTEAWNEPGHYVANFIPTAPGAYRFRFTGSIEDMALDETFESSPTTFDEIGAARDIQFPVQTGSAREVESAVRGVASDLSKTDDDVSSARTMGLIGIVIGGIGLVIGATALAVSMRKSAKQT